MGKQYKALTRKDIDFIKQQKLFYIASCSGKEVNLSPKGYDAIRVLDKLTLLYLDFPGSGNRTYRDAMAGGEFTLVFNAFEGAANITRVFCKAEPIEKDDERFEGYLSHFGVDGSYIRQLFVFDVYAVECSCGMSVPYMKYVKQRNSLKKWAKNMEEDGRLQDYLDEHKEPPSLTDLDSVNDTLF
jgi:hypothetical protein